MKHQQVIKNFEEKIRKHQHALNVIKSIPLGKLLHIKASYCMCDKNGTITDWAEGGVVAFPTFWNSESIRCRVLAVENLSWFSKTLLDSETKGKKHIDIIRYLNIFAWKLFKKDDAGLYVNWAVLSQEFKTLAFGA
jgi:hypothetical protein